MVDDDDDAWYDVITQTEWEARSKALRLAEALFRDKDIGRLIKVTG